MFMFMLFIYPIKLVTHKLYFNKKWQAELTTYLKEEEARINNEISNELWAGEYANRLSADPYPNDWGKRKKYIREKYNFQCFECSIDLKNDTKYLDIHHTYSMVKTIQNPLKKNNPLIPKEITINEPHHLDSLIPLCIVCHASKSRGNHYKLFKTERAREFQHKYFDYLIIHNKYFKNYNKKRQKPQ